MKGAQSPFLVERKRDVERGAPVFGLELQAQLQ